MLDAKIPSGSLESKWTDYKGHVRLVNPANKRKIEVIIVGTGLAGASAAAVAAAEASSSAASSSASAAPIAHRSRSSSRGTAGPQRPPRGAKSASGHAVEPS
jgi:succinate dehydrogenase/fumarate reductase flavoprotein subunit